VTGPREGDARAALREIPRTLGRLDLVLLKVVAIVNINNVPPTAVYGRASLVLWPLAFAAFFVPEAVAVLRLARRHPGEGGIYLWTRREFGEAHGFLSGWCYWTNNLFYVPVLLVYMAGIVAFGGGAASASLVDNRLFVAAVAFGWLLLITWLNVRGLRVGKWVQNTGAAGTFLTVALVLVAAALTWTRGHAATPPVVTGVGWELAPNFAVMCYAFIGIELASTMGDEIRDPARDLRPAILIAGAVALASYVLVTAAVLALVPVGELGVIQGIMQAVSASAADAGLAWMVAPIAILMGLSIGGAASAWFAGSSRIPFVAGLTSALPAALGRVHPRWGSPHVALVTCAALAALLTLASLAGSTVTEAFQVLLKASIVIQLVPFVYLFLALVRMRDAGRASRFAGAVGLATTVVGMVAAFIPTGDVENVLTFEAKMVVGVAAPTLIGWLLFRRARRAAAAAGGT
jgi:glutamate:GABA antiporter